MFATNISCIHLVSLAQAGFDQGLLMGNFEWMAGFVLILLALFFVPFYMRSKVATLPDFLEKRYCRECRDWLAVVSMVAAIIFHIAFPLVTGWVVLHGVFGIEKWTCIFLMCGLTAIYTVFGGLAAVVITETVQAVVLLIGAVLITWFAWDKAGGWDGMASHLAGLRRNGQTHPAAIQGGKPEFPWYAILLGYPVLGIWYLCADQTIVQRVLGAKDENHARVGPLFCAAIKMLPVVHLRAARPDVLHHPQAGRPARRCRHRHQGSLWHDDQDPVAARAVRRDCRRPDGRPDGQPGQRRQLHRHPVLLRPLEALQAGDARSTSSSGSAASASLASFGVGIALVPLLDRYESIFAGSTTSSPTSRRPSPASSCSGCSGRRPPAAAPNGPCGWAPPSGVIIYSLKTLHKWKPEVFGWVPPFFRETPFMLMTFYMFVACVAMQIAFTYAMPKLPGEDPKSLHWKNPLDAVRTPGWPGLADYRVLSAITFAAFVALFVYFR